jgi:uncharacterized SAM-binding protein YcdF (DUF218 family)
LVTKVTRHKEKKSLQLSRSIQWILLGLILFILAAGLRHSGRFLVVDEPRRADVILVLAGDTEVRPARAVELAAHGYAPKIILDVPEWATIYGQTEAELALDWGKAQAIPVSVCVTHGLSTKAEAFDVRPCLDAAGARSVLIVTSDFHTRRALSILQWEIPGRAFSVAAAYGPREFGVDWWQHREWTKTNFYEWMRLLWWELVDRWS